MILPPLQLTNNISPSFDLDSLVPVFVFRHSYDQKTPATRF